MGTYHCVGAEMEGGEKEPEGPCKVSVIPAGALVYTVHHLPDEVVIFCTSSFQIDIVFSVIQRH